MLTDDQLRDRLHRELNGVEPSPELLARLALISQRGRAVSRPSLRSVCLFLASAGAIAVAFGAIVLIGHRAPEHGEAASGTGLQAILSRYAILRRPQTAADRVGASPSLPPSVAQLGIRATVVPGLTRVVRDDGARVTLFVVRMVAEGSPRPAGSRFEAERNRYLGDSLWVQTSEPGARARPVDLPTVGPVSRESVQDGSHLVAVVPDNVLEVRWQFPRQFDTTNLVYEGPSTVTAIAHDNVAAARIRGDVLWATMSWAVADGRLLSSAHSTNYLDPGVQVRTRPGPETPASRAAEKDPATPNAVFVVPSEGTTSTRFNVYFRSLLNGHQYAAELTPPHPGCARPTAKNPSGVLRGMTVQFPVNGVGTVKCTGTYRITLSVLDSHGHPYPPFGSAAFVVH